MKGKGQRDQSRNHHHDRITNCQRCTWYGGGAFDIKISEISDHKYCKAQETIIFQGRRPQRDFATCSIGNPSDLGWVWTSTLGENSRCWFSCQRRRAPGGNGVLSWNLPQKQLSRRTDRSSEFAVSSPQGSLFRGRVGLLRLVLIHKPATLPCWDNNTFSWVCLCSFLTD